VSEKPRTTEGLVQLISECPRCHKKESRRVAEWRIALYRDQDPERIAETVTCSCGRQYYIKVAAYQGAA
jgi:hypothetical protein